LHNKPIGCGASAAYAPGPDDEEEEEELCQFISSYRSNLYSNPQPWPI
jgi:hypothetical protein